MSVKIKESLFQESVKKRRWRQKDKFVVMNKSRLRWMEDHPLVLKALRVEKLEDALNITIPRNWYCDARVYSKRVRREVARKITGS